MITLGELLGPLSIVDLPEDHQKNLELLCEKMNLIRDAYGKPLKVTSGYRSLERHLAIYAAKGITDQSNIPMKSNHLVGLACDVVPIEDDIKHLHLWIDANLPLMVDIGLYFESFVYTPQWTHIQVVPPKSGKRFFVP